MQKTVEKGALVEEVMAFMEEQGMARSYCISTTDLATLSGMPRAFEIMEETLGGEVRAKLEAFAGNKSRHETISSFRRNPNRRYDRCSHYILTSDKAAGVEEVSGRAGTGGESARPGVLCALSLSLWGNLGS